MLERLDLLRQRLCQGRISQRDQTPGSLQDLPGTPPDSSKIEARRRQDPLRSLEHHQPVINLVFGGLWTPPRTSPDSPRTPQDRPRDAPRRPRDAPGTSQDPPKRPNMLPKSLLEVASMKEPKKAQNSIQNGAEFHGFIYRVEGHS